MSDTLWSLDHVGLGHEASPRLADVSIEIHRGVTALVGYSGAGKTSLLNLLVGYESPDRGTITSRLTSAADDARLPLFWGPPDDGLWPHTTALDHIDLVLPRTDGVAPARGRSAAEWLEDFDLSHVAAAVPGRLSRGEASRLAVARAVASEAAVFVLDEPFAHVDPARRSRYWERLISAIGDSERSLVFASHEPGDVLRYAHHAVGMCDGRVVFDGEMTVLYESPPDEAAALLLGPVNWLPTAECAHWRIDRGSSSPCVRPEHLRVEPNPEGTATVVASRSGGSMTESELRHTQTGSVRRFHHQTTGALLAAGTRVRLALCSLLAMIFCAGCLPETDGPQLEVAAERRFSLPAKGPLIPQPRDVAIGLNGEKVVLDNAGRVLVYDSEGELVRQWDMPASADGNPEGTCVLPDGRVVVADTHYHRVIVFDRDGNVVDKFGERGRGPGQFIYPVAVTTDPDGHLYVAEYGGNDRIQKFDSDGNLLTAFGSFGTGEGQFQRPSGMIWHDGKIYVVDAFNNRGLVFSDSGESLGTLGTTGVGLHYPYDMSLGSDGRLYVIEYAAGRLTVLTTDGVLVARYGSTGTGSGHFQTPWGLAVDDAGRIWVADTGNRRIVELVLADSGERFPGGIAGGGP